MASEAPLLVVTDIHDAPESETCLSGDLPVAARLSLAALSGAPDLSGEALHQHLFANAGMARAVTKLKRHILGGTPLIGLGYSAGGTALWQAAANGATLVGLICISSTRLRNAATIPIPTQVYFGDQDPGRPSEDWLASVPDQATILHNATHAFYADTEHPTRSQLCKRLANTVAQWQTT